MHPMIEVGKKFASPDFEREYYLGYPILNRTMKWKTEANGKLIKVDDGVNAISTLLEKYDWVILVEMKGGNAKRRKHDYNALRNAGKTLFPIKGDISERPKNNSHMTMQESLFKGGPKNKREDRFNFMLDQFKKIVLCSGMKKNHWKLLSKNSRKLTKSEQIQILRSLATRGHQKILTRFQGQPGWIAIGDETGDARIFFSSTKKRECAKDVTLNNPENDAKRIVGKVTIEAAPYRAGEIQSSKKGRIQYMSHNLRNPEIAIPVGSKVSFIIGKKFERFPHYIWTLIPPYEFLNKLPLTDPYYHGSDTKYTEETAWATKMLITENNIFHLCFKVSEFPIPEGAKTKTGKDPIGAIINGTMPLVLEFIRSKHIELSNNNDIPPIEFFAERHGEIKSGSHIYENTGREILTAWKERPFYSPMSIKKSCIIDKEPIEHPFLSYPDILGRLFDDPEIVNFHNHEFAKQCEKLRSSKHVIEIDYTNSMASKTRGLLTSISNPISFVEKLYSLDIVEFKNQIVILRSMIRESIKYIVDSGNDLNKLLGLMNSKSKHSESSEITSLIFDLCFDIFSSVNLDNDPLLNLDLKIATLGSMNHTGDVMKCEMIIEEIEKIRDSLNLKNIIPPKHRVWKYQTLCIVHQQNKFDFDLREMEDERHNLFTKMKEGDMGEEEKGRLGSIALTLALRGNTNDAIIYEKFLMDNSKQSGGNYKRRLCHSIELELEEEEE